MISMYSSTNSNEHSLLTNRFDRVVNIILVLLFAVSIILHVVSLSVVVAKDHEIVDKFDPRQEVVTEDEVCIFYIDDDHPIGDVRACNFVIYGSGALAGCGVLMIIFLMVRSEKLNYLYVVDIVEIIVTGILAGVIANVATDGATITCHTITHNTGQSKCSDIYLYGHKKPYRAIRFYPALMMTMATSWLAVTIMAVITMVTMIRVLLFIVRGHTADRRMVTMVKYDKLQDVDIDD